MDRRKFFQNSLGAVGAAALARGAGEGAGLPGEPDAANAAQPNVIWFLGDQFRSFAISCNGDPNVHTPNLDILSRTGVNFDHAVSCFPLCSPFRGSMLTGRYPHHAVPGHQYRLPAGQPTIAQPFHEAGYQTAYFGKWHVDGFKEQNGRTAMHIVPPDRRGGFDEWIGYENNNSQWDCWVHGGAGKDAFQYRLPGYETDELTNLLIKYLKERGEEAKAGKGKPFFAVCSVEPPHSPHVAPAEFMSHYNGGQLELRANVPPVAPIEKQTRRELAGYYAQIENLDWNLGRVRKTLEEIGMQFNTYILQFADHGDMMGSHGHFQKTTPLEESIRIPMIVSGGVPYYDGNRSGRPAIPFSSVDIAPTTLGLCGIRKPSWMEGTDYSHYRLASRPQVSEPDSAYLEQVVPPGYFGPIEPVDTLVERVTRVSSKVYGDCIDLPWRGIVTRDGWKYACLPNTSWLMFNLNDDPYELANLAHYNQYRTERQKLIARLKQWVSDTGDTFPVPDN
ncbi:MAG TPA: sulfatase [Terriglobia bacterium]|nr:sulfatase [Terriglobia bacterium]